MSKTDWRSTARMIAHYLLIAHLIAGVWLPAYANTMDQVVFGITLEPNSLDPTAAPAAAIGEVVHYNVLEGLVKIEENGDTTPLLADSWQISADGHRYTFHLRSGVRFHDGQAFDASAVKYSFTRAQAPDSGNKSRTKLFDNIERIDTPDPYTVVLELRHRDPHLLYRLGESPAVILHPASAEQASMNPIGTGPFRFERWDKGHAITLVKWPEYRNAGSVQLQRAVFRFVNSFVDSTELPAEIDVFFNFATKSVLRNRLNERYQVLIGSSSSKTLLALNNRHPPLDDLRVRRAISHAIDRAAVIQQVLEGRGDPIGSHYSPTEGGYLHLADRYPHDPARARALLAEVGIKGRLRLKLSLPPTPYARDGGKIVAQQLAEAGIDTEIELVNWPDWLNGAFKGKFEMTLINHVEPLDYDIYSDRSYYFGYDSAEFRALVDAHRNAESPRQRNRLLADIQRKLADDAVNAWLYAPQISTLTRKGLEGLWVNYPIYVHDLAALRWR
ncbi:ABC transporter substrate-binding protein [Azoarcus sp. L1K30]|uniref:ABC transporter substrate-binding protein n=1 Tax=Azoarcus sp. L1K30 TaxID=2820277 RepID=UPI0020119A48|nr:ABC transporter substrate-binding protein [Azoarcus sp. L1K30]